MSQPPPKVGFVEKMFDDAGARLMPTTPGKTALLHAVEADLATSDKLEIVAAFWPPALFRAA